MRVLIVDDEPLARRGVRVCLSAAQDVEIIGECSSGQQAIHCIQELHPDLVFLDVQMPDMNGFEVVARIDSALHPLIIFLTAYDEFALQAFSVHALDYVLKPIHDGRFAEALDLARQRFAEQQASTLLQNIKHRLSSPTADHVHLPEYLEKIAVKNGSRTIFVPVEAVEWIEAAGDYVALHAGKSTHLIRETLDGLGQRLDPAVFARIHRSIIVSRKHIDQLRSLRNSDASLRLLNGTELRVSRRYRFRL
jgi:two-component system LytT family response regulator